MQQKNNQKNKKLLNSIVEVKIDGKLSLVSLYDDLPHFEYDLTIDNLKNSNIKLKTCIQELKQHITKLENENSHLKTTNAVVLKNITSLYKTASKEIQRKDNMINELRKSQLYAKPKIVSKMFSCNGNQNKPSPALELGIKTHQKQMEANNILKMNIQPDKNIPKTVYYKRLCHKFAMENKINEFKNKNSKENEKDKIITDKKYPTLELETETHAKRTTEDNNSCKPEDQIENKDLIVNEFTDKNIMNTVHCKPLYQKFDEENETIEFENKKPEEIDKIITDKKNEDLNLKLNVYQKQIEVINNSGKPENLNIPKTVFCQRPCQKFDNENKSIEFENKNIEEIDEIIANKKTSAVNLEIETHSKRTTEDINNSSKSEDQIENKDLTVAFTDKNIMNTVHCKPLYQKFDEENETIEFENKKPEEIDKIITDKKNEDLNLKLNVYQKQIEVINNSGKPENLNIPKTVFCQRPCQKFDNENKSIEFENKNIEEIDEIIANKKTSAVNLEIETHSKRTTEDINNSSKSEDQIENKDLTVVFTDKNIMNTVYCKPLYQKFDKENEPIEFENKKPEEIDKIITDKKNEDINLRLNVYQKQIEVINNSDKPENQNEINDDFTTNIQPNKNISKTVCYQRLCQKLDKVNETIKFENKKPEEIDKIITNKITEDKNELNNINKSIHQYNPMSDKSSETSLNTSESNQLPVHFEVEHGALFRNSRKRKVIMLSTSDDNKPITRKGRRVKLITIKNNYSQPIPSFNGAKKTEIDFSKNSIHIEKVVESSSLFYIPQVKKRRTMNFGDCNS